MQARLRMKPARRILHGSRSLESGYGVSCDFSEPFDPDVDGFTLALVTVKPAHETCFSMALQIYPDRERRRRLVYGYLDRLRLPAR